MLQLNKGKVIENSRTLGFGADTGLSRVQFYLILTKATEGREERRQRQGRECGPHFSTKKKSEWLWM